MEVDAIEDNKIVRVSEEYARLQGLLIIRKKIESNQPVQPVPLSHLRRAERRAKPQIDEFRKPLDYRKNNVIQELKENFQWDISRKRREMNLSRRQLAGMAGASEDEIINLENGFLPKDNFILLNKVEKALGISVRRGVEAAVSLAPMSRPKAEESPKPMPLKEEAKTDSSETIDLDISGEEIELD